MKHRPDGLINRINNEGLLLLNRGISDDRLLEILVDSRGRVDKQEVIVWRVLVPKVDLGLRWWIKDWIVAVRIHKASASEIV